MTQQISVIRSDGVEVDLDRCVDRSVEGVNGLLVVPAKRGSNLVIPGAHGELHIPGKRHQAGAVVLPMWVRGVLSDGSIPDATDSGPRLLFLQNLRELISTFVVDELVTIRHTLSDGTAREIRGEVTATVEPEVSGRGRYSLGRMAVALSCPSPFWSDLDPVTEEIDAGAPQTLTAFTGASAPMEDLLVEFGPQNNPRLEQPSSGIFVRMPRVITSGQTVTVDTAQWQVYGSGGVAGGLYEDLEYGGRGTTRWFALRPEPGGGAPVVELTNTGASAGVATVTGKRKYKIG